MMKKLSRLLITLTIIIILTGCGTSVLEKRKITNNAINYFSAKYNINKKNIKINRNFLYGKDETCLDSCGENYLYINYNNEKFIIKYNPSEDYYGDNYQYNQIYEDFLKYLNTKFNYVNEIKIDSLDSDVIRTSNKYNGNLKDYFKNIKKHMYDDGKKQGFTWVKIWIEAKNGTEAKELNQKYSKELITELEDLEVNYNITISTNSKTNEYSSFYHYHVYDSYFYLTDKVDNHRYSCQRSELKYRQCY